MPKTIEIVEPYFSHDINARSDEKIVKMFFEFRKRKQDYSDSVVRDLLAFASYGVYWSIVEYMHRNSLEVSDVEMLADEFRIDSEILKTILTKFDLFRQEDDVFINDRIERNINKQQEKTNKNKDSANIRWLLSAYDKAYEEEFGASPVLDENEKKKLITYSKKIEGFKEMLPDILYTLHGIKFDNDINFKPTSNWLLKNNNLAQILNGQYGKLKHKQTKAEREAKEKQLQEEQKQNEMPSELQLKANSICNKIDAMELIMANAKILNGRIPFLVPTLKELKNRFDITDKELREYAKE